MPTTTIEILLDPWTPQARPQLLGVRVEPGDACAGGTPTHQPGAENPLEPATPAPAPGSAPCPGCTDAGAWACRAGESDQIRRRGPCGCRCHQQR